MRAQSLPLLVCPNCHHHLKLVGKPENGGIENAILSCLTCKADYPVVKGIPHFIKEDELIGLNKKFAHLYNWFSLIYAAFSKVGLRFLGTTEARARRELVSRLAPQGKVLEVSIGPGVNLPFLLERPGVTDVYGLDISIGQINRARSLVKRKAWPVDLFLGNGESLPFINNGFDSVFHVGGINFFTNKQKAIDEMIRVAKPGARLMICDENESGAEWYERFLPGFKGAFHDSREIIKPPIDLIPDGMLDCKVSNIWNEFMYCIEFQKPHNSD
jgi:SAM-dependent methyltransferase